MPRYKYYPQKNSDYLTWDIIKFDTKTGFKDILRGGFSSEDEAKASLKNNPVKEEPEEIEEPKWSQADAIKYMKDFRV